MNTSCSGEGPGRNGFLFTRFELAAYEKQCVMRYRDCNMEARMAYVERREVGKVMAKLEEKR